MSITAVTPLITNFFHPGPRCQINPVIFLSASVKFPISGQLDKVNKKLSAPSGYETQTTLWFSELEEFRIQPDMVTQRREYSRAEGTKREVNS